MENDERLKDSETTPQLMLTRILYFHFLNVKHPFLHKKTVVFIFKLNSTINIPCRRPNFVLCKSLKSINVTHIFPFTVSNLPPNKHVYSLVLIWQNRELVCRPSEHDVRSTPYHRWLPERTSKMRDERTGAFQHGRRYKLLQTEPVYLRANRWVGAAFALVIVT